MTGLLARNKTTVILVGAVVLVIADRILKQIALASSKTIYLLGNILTFSLDTNNGVAFSIGREQNLFWLIAIVAAFILFFCIRLAKQKKFFEAASLVMVLLGAASNLYDRIFYGSVIDYLSFLSLTIFNLADISIILGALSYILYNRTKKALDS